jgi:eukaryotic-like serine/threonine-protein kinase
MDVVAQCAAGLAAAHQAGLAHGSLTPANILISNDGLVKLTGFGSSHAAAAPVATGGTLLGTPAYAAPERVRGDGGTVVGDLYSLGVVAYQCLVGRVPFSGPAAGVALAHRRRPLPPLPPSVPAEAAALVGYLTANDPRARPASAGEVARRAGEVARRAGALPGHLARGIPVMASAPRPP